MTDAAPPGELTDDDEWSDAATVGPPAQPAPADPPAPAAAPLPRRVDRRAQRADWHSPRAVDRTLGHDRRVLSPAVTLWLLLLATNGLLGFVGVAMRADSPVLEVVGTSAMTLIVAVFAIADRKALSEPLARLGFTARTWWMPLAAVGAFWVFMTAYLGCAEWLAGPPAATVDSFAANDWPFAWDFVLTAIVTPIIEETAFRGVILARLDRVMAPRDAWLVQAAAFSVLHMEPMIFVSHFVMGLVFGWLRRRTGSLYPSMLTHAVWNGLVLVTSP